MGWASGSELAEEFWELVERFIPPRQKRRIAKRIIDMMEHRDCDTIDEAQDLCLAAGRVNEDEDE